MAKEMRMFEFVLSLRYFGCTSVSPVPAISENVKQKTKQWIFEGNKRIDCIWYKFSQKVLKTGCMMWENRSNELGVATFF